MEDDEAVLGGGLDDISPGGTGFDTHAAGTGVDLDAAQARLFTRIVSSSDDAVRAPRPVPGPSVATRRPRARGEPDHRDHFVDAVDPYQRRRPLIDREVPRPPSVVPVGVTGNDDSSRHPCPQGGHGPSVGRVAGRARASGVRCHGASGAVGILHRR